MLNYEWLTIPILSGGGEGWAVHQGGEKIFVSFDNTGKILERTISD